MLIGEVSELLPQVMVIGQTVLVRVMTLVTAGLEGAMAETPTGADEAGALGTETGITERELVAAGVDMAGVVMAGVDEGMEEAPAGGVLVSEQGTVSVSVTVSVTVPGGVGVEAGAVGAGVVELEWS